jgi:signal transduction histidine kinase
MLEFASTSGSLPGAAAPLPPDIPGLQCRRSGTLIRVAEERKPLAPETYDTLLRLFGRSELDCCYLIPFSLHSGGRFAVALAGRRLRSAGGSLRARISDRRKEYLERTAFEIWAKLQDVLGRAELREALDQRGELMAHSGHLLKAPLGWIYGQTDYLLLLAKRLRSKIPDDEMAVLQRTCGSIDENVLHVYRKLDTFMLFTTSEAGAAEYHFDRPIDVGQLLATNARNFTHLAAKRGIRISIAIPQDLPAAHFDEGKLQILFGVLMDNAVKYSFDGREIRVSAAFRDDASVYVLSVSDFGLGIPDDERELVFEPYARSRHKDRTRYIPGTGIGLSVARDVVEKHGGRILVTSRQGQGLRPDSSPIEGFNTTFWIILHRRRADIGNTWTVSDQGFVRRG